MPLYETYIQNLQPSPLAKTIFLSFIGAFGKEIDKAEARLERAGTANNTKGAPADALNLLGQERLLTRYPSESDATYRARLKRAFPIWAKSGFKNGLLEALNGAFPLASTSWLTTEYFENPSEFFTTGFWSQFEVSGNVDPILLNWTIGDSPFSAKIIGDPALTIGSTATPEQILLIKNTILEFKPAYTIAVRVLLLLAAGEVANVIIQGFQ